MKLKNLPLAIQRLLLAKDHHCKSVAFPNISTGIYKFPKELAAQIAFETVYKFVMEQPYFEKNSICMFR
jgi:O-acetyl-ADP-ribose deacetylase (regulator of RNase III)